MKNSIDPFTVEVIRHALTAAAEEMSLRRHALGALAAAARGRRPLIGHHRSQGRPDRPGPRHPDPSRRHELHGEEVPRARAGRAPAAGRRLVPQPARGRRQPPARRQGDPADLPRRPSCSPSPSASPIGATSAAPGPAAISPPPPRPGRRACASRRCACSPPTASTRRSATSCWPTCAARPNARATCWPRSPRRGRPRRAWCGSARSMARPPSAPRSTGWTIFPKRRCARRSRGLPDGVYEGEDFLDDDGPGGTARGHPRAHRDRGRPRQLRLQRHRRCRRRPAQHDAVRRHGRGLLRHQGGRRPGDPAQRRLLPRARGAHAAGLDPRARHRQAGGRRQPRDLAARRRRHHARLRAGGARAADGGRLDDGRPADLRRHSGATAPWAPSTRPMAAAKARAPIATACPWCASISPTP